MKHIPKTPNEEINLPKRHPLMDLLWLSGGTLLLMLLIYIVSGFLVDYAVRYLPPSFDNDFEFVTVEVLEQQFEAKQATGERAEAVKDLFAALRKQLPKEDIRNYKLHVLEKAEANAFALPGGTIVVFTGLLNEVNSENELAMILGHELGHVNENHHWKSMGRSLLFGLTMLVLSGNQSALQANVSSVPFSGLLRNHSRSQESDADSFGLNLICAHYGHSSGAKDFFQRHANLEGDTSVLLNITLTHPPSQSRLDDITQWAAERECGPGQIKPWTHAATPVTQ